MRALPVRKQKQDAFVCLVTRFANQLFSNVMYYSPLFCDLETKPFLFGKKNVQAECRM